jgi:uncharacterized protein DUF6629
MCFSTTASFVSSAILLTIGAAAMSKTQTNSQRVLAAMPLLFAFQQFAEGFVWLSALHLEYAHWKSLAMYSFLIFAQPVWPLFVPIAVVLLEKDERRRKILSWFVASGVVSAIFFICCLCFFKADVEVGPYHIKYVLDFPMVHRWFYGLLYFIPAFFPMFVSGIRRMRLLGFLLLASYLVSRFCFNDYIVSVWCFFGALCSITVLFIIKEAVATDRKYRPNVIV